MKAKRKTQEELIQVSALQNSMKKVASSCTFIFVHIFCLYAVSLNAILH